MVKHNMAAQSCLVSVCLAGALALAATGCGGGSSSETPAEAEAQAQAQAAETVSPAQPAAAPSTTVTGGDYTVTMTPGKIGINAFQGWDGSAVIQLQVAGPKITEYFVELFDADQVLTGMVMVYKNSLGGGNFKTVVSLNSQLPAGHYAGTVQLKICRDYFCNNPLPGGPWLLPYEFNVSAGATDQRPVQPLSGVPDWTTYQGNAAHTGYVPLSVTRFAKRWQWKAPFQSQDTTWALFNKINPIAVANGLVYVTTRKGIHEAGFDNYVWALSEQDGHTVWQTDLGEFVDTGPPALSDTHVFVASSVEGAMWKLDKATGKVVKREANTSLGHTYAPTVLGNGVYTNVGSGGLAKFDTETGDTEWMTSTWHKDHWTPAVNNQYVFTYLKSEICCFPEVAFNVIDPATGETLFHIDNPDPDADQSAGYSTYGSPVITSDDTVLSVSGRPNYGYNHLARFHLPSRSVSWKVSGAFPGNPVTAKGVIYIAQSSPFRVEARRESDGVVLWTWAEPNALPARILDFQPAGNMVVTDTHVFVSSAKATYAIDLAQHTTAWTYPRAGELAISSSGVLYIVPAQQSDFGDGNEGRLLAFNLR